MLANIIIMALILGYCAYIIYKNVKNAKEGNTWAAVDAAATVEAAADAAGLLSTKVLRSLLKNV